MGKRPKAKTGDGTRKALARKLVRLRITHARIFRDEAHLKATLIARAAADGEGFREVFDEGQVSVSPPKPKECRGNLPVVDVEAFNTLPDAQRDKLVDGGLIRVEETWTKAFHGRCQVKTF